MAAETPIPSRQTPNTGISITDPFAIAPFVILVLMLPIFIFFLVVTARRSAQDERFRPEQGVPNDLGTRGAPRPWLLRRLRHAHGKIVPKIRLNGRLEPSMAKTHPLARLQSQVSRGRHSAAD